MGGATGLDRHREAILAHWFDRAIGVYADEAATRFAKESNRFANPVGTGLRDNLARILDALLCGRKPATEALDNVLRVRAIQEMPASTALRFLAELPEVAAEVAGRDAAEDVRRLEEASRETMLAGFDAYMACREQVWKIRATELRSRSQRVLEGLNAWRARRDGLEAPEEWSRKEVSE